MAFSPLVNDGTELISYFQIAVSSFNLELLMSFWDKKKKKKMWPTASGATQETKYKNVKISLPSTKQEREKGKII